MSHDNNLKEIEKKCFREISLKEFRYSSKDSRGTKHGINITDAKRIVRLAINKVSNKLEKKILNYFMNKDQSTYTATEILELIEKAFHGGQNVESSRYSR